MIKKLISETDITTKVNFKPRQQFVNTLMLAQVKLPLIIKNTFLIRTYQLLHVDICIVHCAAHQWHCTGEKCSSLPCVFVKRKQLCQFSNITTPPWEMLGRVELAWKRSHKQPFVCLSELICLLSFSQSEALFHTNSNYKQL